MLLLPEILLLVTVCVLFLAGPLLVSDASNAPSGLRNQWGFLSVATLAIAWMIWINSGHDADQGALFHVDSLVWYTRALTLSAGIVLALVLWNQIDDGHAAEAHACLLAILAGTNLVAAADDLVSLFLALELVSIPTYVILYLPRRDRPAREATIKYLLLSAFSSALLLYGMSWLYGIAGSTQFAAIAEAMASILPDSANWMPAIAVAFIIAGLCFRIAAVPFHFYAPDVFEGTIPANVAMLSFIPKVVGFVALLRLLPIASGVISSAGWVPESSVQLTLACLAVVTMFVGNLMAWRQSNLYRLMAYSSVAHAGYMLVGLTVGNIGEIPGVDALLYYLAAYGMMTIGVLALFGSLGTASYPARTDLDIRGLNRSHPAIALLLAVGLLSLTGLPPTVGFFGKLNLFLASWEDATSVGRTLAILLALNAAIAAYYYLRLVAIMFLDPQEESAAAASQPPWSSTLAGAICIAGSVLFFIKPQFLWEILP